MAKQYGRARFYISCNHFCTLYILMKIFLVKLKNVHTSTCLKLNYGSTKQKQKNVKVAKMSAGGGRNRSSENSFREEWVISFCVEGEGGMIRTWGRVFLAATSKNEQI